MSLLEFCLHIHVTGTLYYIKCIACVVHTALRLKRSAFFVEWKFLSRIYGSTTRYVDLKGALPSLSLDN